MRKTTINFLPLLFLLACSFQSTQDQEQFELQVINNYISDIEEYLYKGATENLYKISLDMNGDNREDLLISGYYKGGWSNSGGEWTIYLNDGSRFIKCDSKLWIYPSAARYQRKDNLSIFVYSRLGCCDGSLHELAFNECKIKSTLIEEYKDDATIDTKVEERFMALEIFQSYQAKFNGDQANELIWEIWE